MVSTAALHARVRGSVPGLGGLKETKMFLPHPRVKVSIVGSLRDREVACSASDRQGLNFESCVWRAVSSQSSHHPQEVLLAQFSLYVHKGGLKPDSFVKRHIIMGTIFSQLCHPFTSLFVRTLCPKTDHLSGDHARLSNQVVSMYFANSISSDVVCFHVSTTIRLCDPRIFFSSGSEW